MKPMNGKNLDEVQRSTSDGSTEIGSMVTASAFEKLSHGPHPTKGSSQPTFTNLP